MFLILKKTVNVVNNQTKSYFVNKLQVYDDLINEKENKLNEIDELIKNKKAGVKDNNSNNDNKKDEFDISVLEYLTGTKYHDEDIFMLNKRIDEQFSIDYEDLVKDFLKNIKKDEQYKFCLNLRKKFDRDTIYKVKTNINIEEAMKEILDDNEYKIFDMFKSVTEEDSVENFVDYLDRLIELNDPHIKILVGNKNENYNHLNKNIETIVDNKIYRGIKIIYKNKMYDFSLSERNV